MTDHQRDAGAVRGIDDVPALLDRRCNRLLNQDVDVARDAGERDLMMEMGGCRDRHGIDAFIEQLIEVFERAAADEIDRARAVLRQRIDDADERHVGQARQYPGVVAAHDAGAGSSPTRNAPLASVFAPDADPFEFMSSTPTNFSPVTSRPFQSPDPDGIRAEALCSYLVVLTRFLRANGAHLARKRYSTPP